MKKVSSVNPYDNRYLVLTFEDETEQRVYDTLLIREGIFEQLNDKTFFNGVVVDEKLKTVTWKGEMDLDPDSLYQESVPFSKLFSSYFDVEDIREAMVTVHDCFVDIYDKEPSELETQRIIRKLPVSITSLAEQWGWNDTEVRENTYRWMKENN